MQIKSFYSLNHMSLVTLNNKKKVKIFFYFNKQFGDSNLRHLK